MSETNTPQTPIRCVVVTPEATAIDQSVDYVALPLFDGEFGVAYNHSPMIGRLGHGELRLTSGENTDCYYVDGGFVQVVDNVVSVITNQAIKADTLDPEEVQQQLAAAINRKTHGEEELALREQAIAQARARLRVAHRPK